MGLELPLQTMVWVHERGNKFDFFNVKARLCYSSYYYWIFRYYLIKKYLSDRGPAVKAVICSSHCRSQLFQRGLEMPYSFAISKVRRTCRWEYTVSLKMKLSSDIFYHIPNKFQSRGDIKVSVEETEMPRSKDIRLLFRRQNFSRKSRKLIPAKTNSLKVVP